MLNVSQVPDENGDLVDKDKVLAKGIGFAFIEELLWESSREGVRDVSRRSSCSRASSYRCIAINALCSFDISNSNVGVLDAVLGDDALKLLLWLEPEKLMEVPSCIRSF